MGKQEPNTLTIKERAEIYIAEYTRLNERLDEMVDKSFSDFKLLGFAWPVFIGLAAFIGNYGGEGEKDPLLLGTLSTELASFLIFLVLLMVVSIISFRDLLVQNIAYYYVSLIRSYEEKISSLLEDESETFKNIKSWQSIYGPIQQKLFLYFSLIMAATIIFIPTWVLYYLRQPEKSYWIIYLSIALAMFIIFTITRFLVIHKPPEKSGE